MASTHYAEYDHCNTIEAECVPYSLNCDVDNAHIARWCLEAGLWGNFSFNILTNDAYFVTEATVASN